MKFCLCVAEFNPLHFGHVRLLDQMNNDKDNVKAVIMSGNFCQRGEMAVLDKYTRAKHAVLAGADIVFELPTCFAVAPAEIFALGAIKLLSGIKGEKCLYFGTEVGEKQDFIDIARASLNESKQFKAVLKQELTSGVSYAKARANALKQTTSGLNLQLLDSSNSILGIEYQKAIEFFDKSIDIHPVIRENNHTSLDTDREFPSAMAIRNLIETGKIKKTKKLVPKFVYNDLPTTINDIDDVAIFKLIENDSKFISQVADCTEGLENRIKALAVHSNNLPNLLEKLETKRYTKTRLQRIIVNNMLGITRDFTEKCLKNKLYLKVLAVADDKKDILSSLQSCDISLITRKSDADNLCGTAKTCFEKDVFANRIYNVINKKTSNEFEMKIVRKDR